MKSRFDFDLGLPDEDVDLDNDLANKIGGIKLNSDKKRAPTDLKASEVAVAPPIKVDKPPQLSSAQQAAFRLQELNNMELSLTPAGEEAGDCEIYGGGEFTEVDIELQN